LSEEQYDSEEDAETTSYSEDESSFLSLSVKPDRNMALLDDYEMEELDYTSDPNHRSG
jgi:GTP-binding protein Era